MIPRRLIRTVPKHTTEQVEQWWRKSIEVCQGWDAVTYRDPIDPADWPLTGHLWDRCASGAQKAGLVRLEALWTSGGVYIDSDVELYRSLDPLVHSPAFAAWEDDITVPDAVIGSEPHNPLLRDLIDEAERRLLSGSSDWATGCGAWSTGPGVYTTLLPGRPDVLLLPPGSFYPYHYNEKHRASEDHSRSPWCFGAHHWAASWVDPKLDGA